MDFPYARTLIVVRSQRTIKKTGLCSTESRYYLSSAEPQQYSRSEWLQLICGHWAGVEIRNHWRRDALMGEDRSRSRNPNLLANLAIIRSAVLCGLVDHFEGRTQPQIIENLRRNPNHCWNLLNQL